MCIRTEVFNVLFLLAEGCEDWCQQVEKILNNPCAFSFERYYSRGRTPACASGMRPEGIGWRIPCASAMRLDELSIDCYNLPCHAEVAEWQTRRSQKPLGINPRVGSSPTFGTTQQ